ncbi:MAG: RES family NAD+ phosphorylase [Gemmatimonadota bacterium]
MTTAWRIVKERHAESAFDGEGARKFGGRWNSPGTAVVYASESRALCLLEVLSGLRSIKPLQAYVVIPVAFDDALIRGVEREQLPPQWTHSPPHPSTQQMGDAWVDRGESVVLRVPSVIIPDEFNFLLNPAHPDFAQLQVGSPQALSIDARLVG